MPGQKRQTPETGEVDDERFEEERSEAQEYEEEEGGGGSDVTNDSSGCTEVHPEYISVQLSAIRKDVQCSICLGIIKQTRTVMECLHRFCRACIDKSIRLGNNECPACRTHCASRRSLRDDPRYDALIAALFPDLDSCEKEELTFHDDDKARNQQIQASIARVVELQSEAARKHSFSQHNLRHVRSSRKSFKGTELQQSDKSGDESIIQDMSSLDGLITEVNQKKYKKRKGIRSSQPSSSAINTEGECIGISPGEVWEPKNLSWGRGGSRSRTRHGSANASSSKSARSSHLNKLANYLRRFNKHDNKMDVHVALVSLDKQSMPSLELPYLCCQPSLTVNHLCEYIALQTPLEAEEVEILAVKGSQNINHDLSIDSVKASIEDLKPIPIDVDPCKDELQIMDGQETLAAFKDICSSSRNYLILAYRAKGVQLANT